MAENHALLATNMYTKPDALQEVKDMSKNLMSGDFERQYSGAMVPKCDKRKRVWTVALAAAVGALAVWLLVLTIVREVQLGQLRQEVDDLTANMIAMSANVKSLNQKIDNNKLLNEFKELEDTIYADEEQDISIPTVSGEKDSDKDSLEKLHGLTVLEDESLGDDEDLFDVDDAESGDWYPDYDRRREKIGTTNMVRLRPEDFTDSVLPFDKDGLKLTTNEFRELKRLINKNPENPDIPALRPMIPSRPIVLDPLPSEPTSEQPSEQPTKAVPSSDAIARDRRSVFPDSPLDAIDTFDAPRVMTKSDERRKTKKYLSNIDPTPAKVSLHTVTRTVRNSDTEEGQRRPFIAAHFHGNTSHLSPEIHEHYKGNGLVRVSHGAAHDVWYPAPWTAASPHPRPTLTRNGHVHVHHTGVYLVYVQIYYLDSHDIISWVLHRTNVDIEGRETLLQCAQSTHSVEPLEKPNSCFSAAALFLKAGDRLAVRNTGGDRHSLMQPEKSFIGLVKLADAEDPTQEL